MQFKVHRLQIIVVAKNITVLQLFISRMPKMSAIPQLVSAPLNPRFVSEETQRKWECNNTDDFVLSEVSRAYDKINSLSNDEGNAMQGIRHMKKKLWNPDYSAITPPCLHSRITCDAVCNYWTTDWPRAKLNTIHTIKTTTVVIWRFAHAFFIFGHFVDVLVLATTWNDLFCSNVDDVSIWWQSFNCVLLSLGPVAQKPINANPRLKVNQTVYFSTPRCCSTPLFSKLLYQK